MMQNINSICMVTGRMAGMSLLQIAVIPRTLHERQERATQTAWCMGKRFDTCLLKLLRRTFEEVEAAARPGGPLARGGDAPLGVAQAFSLRHRDDLLARCPREDIAEMRETVLATLNRVAGKGESVVLVCCDKLWRCQHLCLAGAV